MESSFSDGGLGEFLSDGVLGEGSSPQVRFGEDMLASLIASCLANDWRFAGLTELLLSNSFPYSLSFPQCGGQNPLPSMPLSTAKGSRSSVSPATWVEAPG